jgi:glutathione synthase/RimK-type ligase-like ATP-grasp enzyme
VNDARSRVALATYEGAPSLAPDDLLLAAALVANGVDVVAAVWSDLGCDWDSFDVVIVRSCWDYHLRLAEFAGWLDRLAKMGMPILNSPVLIRWNADKRYLLDLVARGVPTVPTFVAEPADPESVYREADARGWEKFVVKPAVSASGYETHLLALPFTDSARATIERVTALGATLVQPFVEEVAHYGELSFTFIDDEYSHTTLKTARAGEFRVQTDHGGKSEPITPSADLVRQAARTIASLPEKPLYARVDGVVRSNELLLMELELIEPNLFLEHGSGSAERLANAIVARVSR